MADFTCKYCGGTEETNLSAAHHVCDRERLQGRIEGLEAHCKMWHREALRLAEIAGVETFYYTPGQRVLGKAAEEAAQQ